MAVGTKVKRVEDLTLGDEYLFETVMQNKELCKSFIETFLEIPDITDIEYISAEESYKDSFEARGVRFDIYVKGQDGVAYVVELQQADTKEIDKRLRYYESMSDSKQLPKGQENTYKDLKDSYILFICRKDLYGRGRYRYSFRTTCVEEPDLKLDDGSYKIVFNTKGTHGEVNEDVKEFLKAIEGMKKNNTFVQKFEAFAEEVKASETWRRGYMQTALRMREKVDAAIEQGLQQGLEQGIEQGIERGIEQGEQSKAIEITKKLLASGVSMEVILNASGLSPREVEKLAKGILKGE